MSSKHHTVIFVPHERAQFRKWRVSNRQFGVVIGSVALALMGGLVSLALFLSSSADGGELARLAAENERLRSLNQTFEVRLGEFRERLADSEDRTRKLAIVAGLQSLGGSAEAGLGGAFRQAPVDLSEASLSEAEARLDLLSGRLEEVSAQLERNLGLVSATPAIRPVSGLVTSQFGHRRDPLTGQRAYHSGIDISAPPGKPVKAAAAGVVTKTGQYGPLGRAVYVAHGFGITTIYGHLSRINVSPGQRLERGEIVGLVGNTGRSTGYHLHYEVHVDGKAVDPSAYFLESGTTALF